jgi:Arc/MetJ family transcription regulator
MRTTLDVDKALLDEAARIAGEANYSKTVNKALAQFVRRQKLEQLRKLIGTSQLVDNWRELEELEMQETEEQFD